MSDNTQIEWTEATWNPVTGCSLASPGCTNCYAMKLAGTRLRHHPSRAGLTRDSKAGPVWTGEVRLNEEWLTQPLHWERPRRIFVCAHGDLFHESVPDEWIDRVFAVMALAPQHTFQVLTKRAKRMREYVTGLTVSRLLEGSIDLPAKPAPVPEFPFANVWLGVSVEDQARADERIPDLLATPAGVRWLSCEPLLGPVDLTRISLGEAGFDPAEDCPPEYKSIKTMRFTVNALAGVQSFKWPGLDWIVAGGESGPGARPMHPDWARALRDQCAAAGVPFFFKQWGEWGPVSEMPEEQIDACYHPAPAHDPDATRRCKVGQCVLHVDATRFEGEAMFRRPAFEQGSGAMTMFAIGKKRAGRRLDGIEHNAYPS